MFYKNSTLFLCVTRILVYKHNKTFVLSYRWHKETNTHAQGREYNIFVCVCMYVCMYLCMYICMYF